jgi:putative flavoprotein involved in K+ transport
VWNAQAELRALSQHTERIETVVVGAGQAGLAVAYHLKRLNRPFVVLEGNARVGDNWRSRWDSLRLFTPARFDSIDGMPFPAARQSFPTKDEMAGYLESYVKRFELPVRTGSRVDALTREDGRFVLSVGDRRIEADNVVVAMATFQKPRIPAFAADLDPGIVQLHSSEYRRPSQLPDGPVLVVGTGNSGAEIARDVAPVRPVLLAGRDVGQLPFRIEGKFARLIMPFLFRVLFHRVLTVRTPMGRKAAAKALAQGMPRIRVKAAELEGEGVGRVGRVAGTRDGRPQLDDGRVLDVASVVWCTGYHPGFSWIDLPAFDQQRQPIHKSGVVPSVPGLYFVGLVFLHSLSSTMIHGCSRDAARIADAIAKKSRRPAE